MTRYGRVMTPLPLTGFVVDRNGDRAPIGFLEDPRAPGTFYPRHLDGSVIFLLHGDRVEANGLAPGQMVKLNSYPTPRPAPRPGWWTRTRAYFGFPA